MDVLGRISEQSRFDIGLVGSDSVPRSRAAAADTTGSEGRDGEFPYQLQHRRIDAWPELAGLPPAHRLLGALTNLDQDWVRRQEHRADNDPTAPTPPGVVAGVIDPDVPGEPDHAVLFLLGAVTGRGAVGELYASGLTRHADLLLDALAEVSEGDLRRAARLLSPFTPDGLGRYDHLRLATEIERLYLFVELMLFFRDGGVDRRDT
jgi:hypothetical protein